MSDTRTVTSRLVLLGPNEPSPVLDSNRPLTIRRPCPCGCDQRENPDLVGYVNVISNGVGFTLEVYDEDALQHLAKALKQPVSSS